MNYSVRLLAVILLLISNQIQAQNSEKLKLSLDCNQEWLCDGDFLRTEMKMFDFVRDRFLCDVQIIQNTQFTNNGGESVSLRFIGNKKYASKQDTIVYFNNVTATENIKRDRMLKYLKMGLLPYISETKLAEGVEIKFSFEGTDTSSQQKVDPWNYWQFSIGSNGFFNGDQNRSESNISNNLFISRETEKSKIGFEFQNRLDKTKFNYYNTELDTTEIIEVRNDRQDAFAQYLIKINEHWAAGLRSSFTRSLFDNIDNRVGVRPSLEYSVFPYKDFNSTRLVFSYEVGPLFSDYKDTTIYLKTSELLFRQGLSATASFTQDWGSINIGATYAHFLNDFSKDNFFLGGAINWNVFKGFRMSVFLDYSLVHDQISLPKLNASRDDLLTQRRLIASSYQYFGGIGFSYTFGSIYNSQVHQTFKGLNYNVNF